MSSTSSAKRKARSDEACNDLHEHLSSSGAVPLGPDGRPVTAGNSPRGSPRVSEAGSGMGGMLSPLGAGGGHGRGLMAAGGSHRASSGQIMMGGAAMNPMAMMMMQQQRSMAGMRPMTGAATGSGNERMRKL
jgi:hypothetical protein